MQVENVESSHIEIYSVLEKNGTFKDVKSDKVDLRINEDKYHDISIEFANNNCKEFSIYHFQGEDVKFYGGGNYRQIYLYDINIGSLLINKSVKIEEQLLISNKGEYEFVYQIGSFNLQVHDIKRTSIHELKVGTLLMSGIPERTLANIFDVCIEEKLELRDFKNNYGGAITFNNIKPNDDVILEIISSDLTDVTFINVDFSKYKSINILDSKLVDTTFISTTWGDLTNISSKKEDTSVVESIKKLRETFRQLKVSMNNQGNKIQELEFYAREMETYGKTLSWKEDREKWLIFKLNKWSNSHGLNWLRPLGLILTVAVVAYLPLLVVEGCQYWYNFFEFILPTHKFDFIDGKVFGWFYPIDLISRIIIGYLIYQMIRAFRRYAMK